MPNALVERLYRLRSGIIKRALKPHAQPKPIAFSGPGSRHQLCAMVSQFGQQKILLVTDKPLVELGLVAPVIAELEGFGLQVSLFDGVEPDPTFKVINTGLAQLHSEACDSVLAFGGGSSMDTAKVIALAASNDVKAEDLVGFNQAKLPALPLFCIPTTAGTGSEVTIAAVPSNDETHEKQPVAGQNLVPLACALDAEVMTGLPPHITAATGMDALTHAIEAYIGRWASEESDQLARSAIKLIFDHLPAAYSNGSDLPSRQAMVLASYYAGLAFSQAMVGFVHAVSHQLGGHYGVPHGLGNAVTLPSVLKFSSAPAQARLAQLADVIGASSNGLDEAQKAQAFIAAVEALNHKLDIPRHLEQIQEQDVAALAEAACKEGNRYPVPRYMSQEECAGLIRGLMAAPATSPST